MASVPVDEKPEEDLTNDERLAWLRQRGVLVEEPADRKGATASATSGRKFDFVKIPADDQLHTEVRSGFASDGDALVALLGPEFAGGDVEDDVLEAKVAEMGQAVGLDAMRKVLAQGGAEKFTLAVPTERNGRETVIAYLDESSTLKGLPHNKRASTIALQCGFPATCKFFGDIFIGRQKWSQEGQVENVDFDLKDLAPGALWMRRAETENLEQQKDLRPEDHAAAQAGGSNARAAGEGDGYSWQDQGEEVEVLVAIAQGTSKKDVKVDFKRQEIRITRPVSLTLKLLKPIEVDGCNWTLANDKLVITVEKGTAEPWPALLA